MWAYNYWKVEENLKKHMESIYEMIKELVEEEFYNYREKLVFLEKSRITVWDPEHGEIQMELYLPVPLESLDTLPELDTSYLEKAKNTLKKYIPEKKTLQKYYERVSYSCRSICGLD